MVALIWCYRTHWGSYNLEWIWFCRIGQKSKFVQMMDINSDIIYVLNHIIPIDTNAGYNNLLQFEREEIKFQNAHPHV